MKGVTAFLKQEPSNEIQLVLNDVISSSEKDNTDWKHDVLFTANAYNEKALIDLSLSKEQYAEIGENLVIRLLALNGLIK